VFEFFDVAYKDIIHLPHLFIAEGIITTLTGASGSGKTTILKMLNKMISPTQGRILFKGKDLHDTNTVLHRRNVTMLSQTPVTFEGDIRENLYIGLRFAQKDIPKEDRMTNVLERVQLDKPLDSPASILSGGEKQRLSLARVILLDPDVYLLDEPSSSLDDETEKIIIEMITEHVRDKKKSMVMATHAKAIAKKYSDSIIDLSKGKVIMGGSDGRNHRS
jgi:putative ABC transport system ATP-binding protein